MKEKGVKVKAKTKKGERQNKVERSKLIQVFFKFFSEVHEIKDRITGKVDIKGCPFKNVEIFAEKAHNKFITRITGLEPFQADLDKLPERLASHFQSMFATSATVTEIHGKKESLGKVASIITKGNNGARHFHR